jgi:hypothetical protein
LKNPSPLVRPFNKKCAQYFSNKSTVQGEKILALCGVVGDEPTYGDLVHYLSIDEDTSTFKTINVFRNHSFQHQ